VCVTDALCVIYGCTFILLSLMWAQLLPAPFQRWKVWSWR